MAALVLLTLEYLSITLAFDALQMLERAGAWGGLGWMGLLGPALIAFGTAFWIFGGAKLREALRDSSPPSTRWLLLQLGVHFVCFAGFIVLTSILFADEAPPTGSPLAWISLWMFCGVATLATLLGVAFGGIGFATFKRELVAPFLVAVMIGFAAWGAGLASLLLWDRLSIATLELVGLLLGLFVSPIYFDPSEAAIGTEDFWVRVLPICSGYEGIGLILVFLSAYLVGFRDRLRFPHALLLIPASIVLVWLLNAARIVALILVGHFISPEIAVGGFHSKAGWLFFCAVALGMVWLSQRAAWFAREPKVVGGRIVNPSAPFLLPLLAVVATALLTGLFVGGFDWFYPLRVFVALLALAWFRRDYIAGLRTHLRGRNALSLHAVAIGVGVYLVWIALTALGEPLQATEPPEQLMLLPGPLAMLWVIARVFGATVTVPIIEELAFRGFLLRRLVDSDFRKVPYTTWSWPAALISSLAFAAAHQQWVAGFVAGLLYAYAQKRRGLLSDAIVAHATSNALIAAQVLLAGHWSLW